MKEKDKMGKRIIQNNQFAIDRNRKGHVAQWKEPLCGARSDVGSKLWRKSHHAHEHPKKNKKDIKSKINNRKEKQAYSIDRTSVWRTEILHKFESVVKSNQNPQHNILSINNYLKLSINNLANKSFMI